MITHLFRWGLAGLALLLASGLHARTPNPIAGERIFNASGGCGCHTAENGQPLSGGRPLKTPFGIYFSTNITPDPDTGIGGWSDADLLRAMREGIAPDGSHYFPVFPYTSYTNMTLEDARAIKAYLFSLAPVAQPSRAHDIQFPFAWRFAQTLWKLLFFKPGPLQIKHDQPPGRKRGAYLVRALVHCGECHTPRNSLGGMDQTLWLAGAHSGAQGDATPNITPDEETGLGRWSAEELVDYLETGMKPDGNFTGASMAKIIDHSTSKPSDRARAAIAAHLCSMSAIRR